jgi:hypothetical protein
MKNSYCKGLATHTDPESCGAAREGGVEALTGDRAGRVFSRVRNSLRSSMSFSAFLAATHPAGKPNSFDAQAW